MAGSEMKALKSRLGKQDLDKLITINNPKVHQFVAKYIDYCDPAKVFVCSDTAEELAFIREQASAGGEEKKLKLSGHTIHFDNALDQGRDKANTKLLVSKMVDFGLDLNATDRVEALEEIHSMLKGMMKNATMFVRFFVLGPVGSEFTIPCLQITDSSYVCHSEDLLYRQGYQEFVRLGRNGNFLKFVHSQGELENGVCRNIPQRRIYIDIEDETVYSLNTQYGGNTIGLKKLALRFAIQRAGREGWLAEHMFLMGVHGPKDRVTYFSGAFPSLCGKTSTSMLTGETIIGDDIAYLRNVDGKARAVNVEKGIFGIIQGVNSVDDPVLWKALNGPGEVIWSNVLCTEDGDVFWIGKDQPAPARGNNFQGEWFPGKKDKKEKEIPPSHPNARVTLELRLLENLDPELDNPNGVELGGIIYGGRDSYTWPPVEESFDWQHGVITKGASLESETTAATLGQEGIREFNPMANVDFLSIPIGHYIKGYLEFGEKLEKPPKIFSVNYFLRGPDGKWLNSKTDKAVWLKWMELRVHKEAEAIRTPTGLIPKYDDLKALFSQVLKREYSKDDYTAQFSLRVRQYLSKMKRVDEIYRMIKGSPPVIFQVIEDQMDRLKKAQQKFGDVIEPEKW